MPANPTSTSVQFQVSGSCIRTSPTCPLDLQRGPAQVELLPEGLPRIPATFGRPSHPGITTPSSADTTLGGLRTHSNWRCMRCSALESTLALKKVASCSHAIPLAPTFLPRKSRRGAAPRRKTACNRLPGATESSLGFFGKCPPTPLGVGICLIFGLFVSSRFRSHKPLPFQQVILPTVLKVTNNLNNYRQSISAQSDLRNFQPTISVTQIKFRLRRNRSSLDLSGGWDRRSERADRPGARS
jgi:hypothetical protein